MYLDLGGKVGGCNGQSDGGLPTTAWAVVVAAATPVHPLSHHLSFSERPDPHRAEAAVGRGRGGDPASH